MLEVLKGSKTVGQIARAYGVHPITITHWKKEFMEKGPEIFSQKTTIHEYERRIQDL
jgi:transposase-like protein